METPAPDAEEAEEESEKISENFFYRYMGLSLNAFYDSDSNIPLDLLTLVYPLQSCIIWNFSFGSGVGKL